MQRYGRNLRAGANSNIALLTLVNNRKYYPVGSGNYKPFVRIFSIAWDKYLVNSLVKIRDPDIEGELDLSNVRRGTTDPSSKCVVELKEDQIVRDNNNYINVMINGVAKSVTELRRQKYYTEKKSRVKHKVT
jgi:hypothetical protein